LVWKGIGSTPAAAIRAIRNKFKDLNLLPKEGHPRLSLSGFQSFQLVEIWILAKNCRNDKIQDFCMDYIFVAAISDSAIG
jgi:hypothetical protein